MTRCWSPEPDGSIRFCIEFKRLNEVSTFNVYPMPQESALLDLVGGVQFLSTIDLTKGYWQIRLATDTCKKIAFATSSRL